MNSASTSPPPNNADDETFTTAAVVLSGPPLAALPSLATFIATKLRTSPLPPLRVLDGAEVEVPKVRMSDFVKDETYKIKLHSTSPSFDGQAIIYKATYKQPGARWTMSDHWRTWEVERLLFASPPHDLLALFDGLVAYFRPGLEHLEAQLQTLVEIFGGRVVNSPSKAVTHLFDLKPSYMTRQSWLSTSDFDEDVLALHPSWLALSVAMGFLVPASLFSLEDSSPHRLFGHVLRVTSDFFVFKQPFEMILASSPPLPPPEPLPCFQDRRIFFDSTGRNLDLSRALSAVVARLGGKIVQDVRQSDWIVTEQRSGSSYIYGVRHPELIMGTLNHILAHLSGHTSEEPIDPRSNLLFYPWPAIPVSADMPSVYISKRYPEHVRRYLTTLYRLVSDDVPSPDGSSIWSSQTVVIAPCSAPFDEDDIREDLELTYLLPKYLEDSFLHIGSGPTFDVRSKSFTRSEFECFSPPDLPRNFHLADVRGERISDAMLEKWSNVRSRWESENQKYSETDCQCSSCYNLQY